MDLGKKECALRRNNPNAGFTMIELVIVIILIGILSATALPKFTNLTVQARNASNQGIAGALGGAFSIAHSAWVSAGASNIPGGSNIVLEGQNVHVNNIGWPDNGKGVAPTAADCAVIWNSILNNPPLAGCSTCVQNCTATSTNGCYIAAAGGSSICSFSLATNPPITVTYDMASGLVGFTSQ